MKDSIRHSVRFVCFAAGFVLLLLISSKIFAPKNNAKESGIDDPNANGILSETEQTIDVLFLGDSECYSAFIPMQLWKKYGITSYNCGTAMQHLYYTEEFLMKAGCSRSFFLKQMRSTANRPPPRPRYRRRRDGFPCFSITTDGSSCNGTI